MHVTNETRTLRSIPASLKFRQLPGLYAIVRLAPDAPVPDWATKGDFTSITRTADELSIVCPMENLPADVHSQLRWICLKLEGPFAFSQTGILLSFIEPLSNKTCRFSRSRLSTRIMCSCRSSIRQAAVKRFNRYRARTHRRADEARCQPHRGASIHGSVGPFALSNCSERCRRG